MKVSERVVGNTLAHGTRRFGTPGGYGAAVKDHRAIKIHCPETMRKNIVSGYTVE
jgi:hypothetical protein